MCGALVINAPLPQYEQALELCVEHGVWVTDALAERFTLPKDEAARNVILEKVAQCAYIQENYKLATKKFTQAGNKVRIPRADITVAKSYFIGYYTICFRNHCNYNSW